jgi:hypothetical protein
MAAVRLFFISTAALVIGGVAVLFLHGGLESADAALLVLAGAMLLASLIAFGSARDRPV